MSTSLPDRLLIFDYSGTLSLQAPAFARPETLREELKVSGLWDLGVKTPEIFWEQIVNPTWKEGSTTPIGYKKIIRQQVKALFPQSNATLPDERIFQAASLFVDRYLGHSRIDGVWRPLLLKLAGRPALRTVIATDHYAEATGAILNFLKSWGVPAAAVNATPETTGSAPVLVANSADLGFHKAERGFWEAVCRRLSPERLRQVLLIDDFGANEQTGDAYADLQKVEKRRQQTTVLLQAVFPGEVRDFFFRPDPGADPSPRDRLMDEVSRLIDRFLQYH